MVWNQILEWLEFVRIEFLFETFDRDFPFPVRWCELKWIKTILKVVKNGIVLDWKPCKFNFSHFSKKIFQLKSIDWELLLLLYMVNCNFNISNWLQLGIFCRVLSLKLINSNFYKYRRKIGCLYNIYLKYGAFWRTMITKIGWRRILNRKLPEVGRLNVKKVDKE